MANNQSTDSGCGCFLLLIMFLFVWSISTELRDIKKELQRLNQNTTVFTDKNN